MLKRSPGLKVHRVPSSTIELPQGSLATGGFVSGCSCLATKTKPEGVVEIRVYRHKECLTGICKYSDYLTQAILAHVAILVQTITYEFLMWTGRCCLISILLFSVAVVGWELSPFPSTYVSYNQRPQESVCAFLVCHHSVSLGFLFRFSLGGPTTDHPCSLPASPDASGASDVIRYRPSQVTQDYRRTRNHHLCLAQTISGLEGLSVA